MLCGGVKVPPAVSCRNENEKKRLVLQEEEAPPIRKKKEKKKISEDKITFKKVRAIKVPDCAKLEIKWGFVFSNGSLVCSWPR